MLTSTVLRLRHPDGQVFGFQPGCTALAIAVTGAASGDGPFETLHEPEDLGSWAADVMGARRIRPNAADVAEAKRLRAAIWHAAEAVVDGRPIGALDRSTLNAFAAEPSLEPRLDPDGRRSWRPSAAAAQLFSTIARDAIETVSGPRASRLRRCEGANCPLLFVDTSRPGTRRWCSMERCGNRAKASAHRRRH